MLRRAAISTALAIALLWPTTLLAGPAGAVPPTTDTVTPAAAAPSARHYRPGAAGIGDPYYPLDGNGGYDVGHYDLRIGYTPAKDRLTGRATITATAKQNLSRFDLDLDGLTVRSITVGGRKAKWTRSGQELRITPAKGIRKHHRFTTVVRYDGKPKTLDLFGGVSGFVHTDDGAVIAGQPHVAATWFPVNDHPADKATYTFRVTVPKSLQVVANGELAGLKSHRHTNTWTWREKEPMASYLAAATIGKFDLRSYRRGGIDYVDAIDPDLLTPVATPRTGSHFAIGSGNQFYQRLSYTLTVPADGSSLSFRLDQERDFLGYAMVEVHTVGQDDWTTVPDANGHTSADPGPYCDFFVEYYPFLSHYQQVRGEGRCTSTGTTGQWWAGAPDDGSSDGYQSWRADLGRWSGSRIEVSISHVGFGGSGGAFLDDVSFSRGVGETSFENDGDTLDGWRVAPAPAETLGEVTPWRVGTVDDGPPTIGKIARSAFDRQPEILSFLSSQFGRYPFSAAGGIVDDVDGLGFALENQTRPIYSKYFFDDPGVATAVVVHELSHQWFGDSVALQRWQDIWLNEGFASYAEWLWSGHEGGDTPQQVFDFAASTPADDPFWQLKIGDPGPEQLFDYPVYNRGAMTLHALRVKVGDKAFFTILRRWAGSKAGGNGTTAQFVALAEKVSGQRLGSFFQTWLYTASKPAGLPEDPDLDAAQLASTSGSRAPRTGREVQRELMLRRQRNGDIGRR